LTTITSPGFIALNAATPVPRRGMAAADAGKRPVLPSAKPISGRTSALRENDRRDPVLEARADIRHRQPPGPAVAGIDRRSPGPVQPLGPS